MPSAGTWYSLTLLPTTDPAWVLPAAFPVLPGPVLAAVTTGATLLLYCLAADATDATFIGLDEGTFSIPLVIIDTEVAETTTVSLMADGGSWIGMRYVPDGSYRYYDDRYAEVRVLPAGDRAALAVVLT